MPGLRQLLHTSVLCSALWLQQPSTSTATPVAASTELHKAALAFVESTGARERLIGSLDLMMQQGREQMQKQNPSPTPAAVDEWVKRMRARFNADDYLTVMVRVYEAHFTENELRELAQAQLDAKAAKTPNFSSALKTKLSTQGNEIQSEVLGGCAQVGAKLGGEVGLEIQKEHPEWFPTTPVPPMTSAPPKP